MPRDAPLPYNDSPPRGGARGRGGRDRSRSPVRDSRRYDDRGDRDYGRDRPRHDDRGDRADRGDRDYGHADRERRYERGGYDRGRGGYSRDTRDSRDSRDRDWDRGDRGDRYGGRGGRAGRDRSRSRERPLDRRAIEEGRRRREEERARGVVYTDDGRKIEPEGELTIRNITDKQRRPPRKRKRRPSLPRRWMRRLLPWRP